MSALYATTVTRIGSRATLLSPHRRFPTAVATATVSPRALSTQASKSTFSQRLNRTQLNTSVGLKMAAAKSFSTNPALKSAAVPPSGPREYDPEIKDMASYVHNYTVDSDLAVCPVSFLFCHLRDFADSDGSSTLLATFSLILLAAVSRLSALKSALSSWVPSSRALLFPMVRRCRVHLTSSILSMALSTSVL